MLFKKQDHRKIKKANPLIGILLFLISVILLILTGPLGFIYGLLHSLFTKGLTGLGEFCLKIAISIDQLGNVLMQHLLNFLWIKKGGYPFGNRDETISSALGRNRVLGKLTFFGKLIDNFLDLIDPNHSLNSIDYFIEPSSDIVDEVAWALIREQEVFCIRTEGQVLFSLPGGIPYPGEAARNALARRLEEDLQIKIEPSSLQFLGIFEVPSEENTQGVFRRISCFTNTFKMSLIPENIKPETAWIGSHDKNLADTLTGTVIEYLQEKEKLN